MADGSKSSGRRGDVVDKRKKIDSTGDPEEIGVKKSSQISTPMVNWSELGDDLLVEIARQIKLYEDFIAFRRVCKSWKLAAHIDNFVYKSDQMPLLMHRTPDKGSNQSGTPDKASNPIGFFSLSKGIITHRSVCLPQANRKKCFSSKGWLLTVNQGLNMTLLHPFSHIQVELPNPRASTNWWNFGMTRYIGFLEKFLLSTSNLLESDYIVMVICGSLCKLAYFKPGQETWITVSTWNGPYCDVVYYEHKFYAINCHGQIMVCDLSGNNINPTVAEQVAHMPDWIVRDTGIQKLYLVESDGEFLVINREMSEDSGTYAFHVFKVDLITNSWRKIKDIGNRALFLGHNSSLSIEVFDPSICKPNCIYYTDDYKESDSFIDHRGGKDMGIYNIQDGSISPHFRCNYRSRSRLVPPMWVEQSFKT